MQIGSYSLRWVHTVLVLNAGFTIHATQTCSRTHLLIKSEGAVLAGALFRRGCMFANRITYQVWANVHKFRSLMRCMHATVFNNSYFSTNYTNFAFYCLKTFGVE